MSYLVYPPAASGITTDDLLTVPNWTLIGRQTSNTAAVTFSGISGYRMLQIRVSGVSQSSGGTSASLLFNGETSGNSKHFSQIYYDPRQTTTPDVVSYTERDTMNISPQTSGGYFFTLVSTISGANSTYHKTVKTEGIVHANAYAQYAKFEQFGSYNGTSAVSSIKFHFATTGVGDSGSMTMSNGGAIELWGAN